MGGLGFGRGLDGMRAGLLGRDADARGIPAEVMRDLGLPVRDRDGRPAGTLWLPPSYAPSQPAEHYLATSNFPVTVLDRSYVSLQPGYGAIAGRGWIVPSNGTIVVQATILGAATALTVSQDGGATWNKIGGGISLPSGAKSPPLPVMVSRGQQFDISASVATTASLLIQFSPSLLVIGGGAPGGTQDVNVDAATLSSATTMQDAATADGLGTALPVSGYGVATVALSGTFSATITWKGVGPDGNTYTIEARQRGAGTAPSSTATATGLYEIDTLNLTSVYADITTYTSGSVTAKGSAQPLAAPASQMSLTGSNPILTGALDIFQVQSYLNTNTANQVVFNTTRGVALDIMEISDGAASNSAWDVLPYNAAGTLLSKIGNAIPWTTALIHSFLFSDMYSATIYQAPTTTGYTSQMFQVTQYNNTTPDYKAVLVRPMLFPFGLKILASPSGASPSMQFNIFGRYTS